MLSLVHPTPAKVVPKPIHNQDGTVWALAKQMLMDMDRASVITPVSTAALDLLLTALVDALDRPVPPVAATDRGGMIETTSNPNLAHWVRKAAEDLDAADNE